MVFPAVDMREPATLQPLAIDGFVEGSDADYTSVRAAMRNNAAFFNQK